MRWYKISGFYSKLVDYMYHVLKTLMTYTNLIYMIKLTINIIIFRCKGYFSGTFCLS